MAMSLWPRFFDPPCRPSCSVRLSLSHHITATTPITKRIACIARGLLLQSSAVGLYTCWTRSRALGNRLHLSRCCLGCRLTGPNKPCIRWVPDPPRAGTLLLLGHTLTLARAGTCPSIYSKWLARWQYAAMRPARHGYCRKLSSKQSHSKRYRGTIVTPKIWAKFLRGQPDNTA